MVRHKDLFEFLGKHWEKKLTNLETACIRLENKLSTGEQSGAYNMEFSPN